MNLTLYSACMLLGVWANAKENPKTSNLNNPQASYKDEAGNCQGGSSKFDIQINNVRARLLTGGDLWWDLSSSPKYEVPKGDGTHPLCSIFAGAIWISGLDAGGNLKCAAQRYRDYGNDFWPGPLDASGNVTQATCSQFDRFFNVYGADIAAAQTAFQLKGNSTTTADIPSDVLAWPAVGNQYLATNPALLGSTFNITDNLAPFFDNDGDGIYNPVKGDYPVIPCRVGTATAYADQMTFYVYNDAGNIHSQTNGEEIGVQVNALAFAFSTSDDLNNMTFYSYQLINKSSNNCYQTYVSQWVDPDLGCFSNDYVGCDVGRSLGICYNGTATDPDCAPENGYGSQLPIVGVEFFEGPISDSGQELGLTSFCYFTGQGAASAAQSDPITAPQYRNFQTGFWGDGSPFERKGSGYNSGGTPTKFCFPSDPTDRSDTAWSECAAGTQPGDRRFVESSGPFTLKSGVAEYVTVGVPWLRPPGNGVGTCPSFQTTIGPVADEAKALFEQCFKVLDGPAAPTLEVRELSNEVIINLVNLKGSNNFGESYSEVSKVTAQGVDRWLGGHGDSTYKFQGYVVYQVIGPQVAASDLSDNTKAHVVAEVDVQDNVAQIVNFVTDPTLGLLVPTLEVQGANAGITNSFDLKNDLFAQGENTQLINNTTYYYTAIAFAYNNYKQYQQAYPDSGGQLTQYLPGRGNFNIYTAIPHIVDVRNTGTTTNSVWGQGVSVQRVEGQGNGGNNIELTPATIEQILNSSDNFADTLTYVNGLDPIGFQVTDPIALKEANFQLQFVDTITHQVGATTSWRLIDMTNNDTIYSDRTLDRPYQQEIVYYPPSNPADFTDYGFSIKLGTPYSVYTLPKNYLYTDTTNRLVYNVDNTASSIQWQDSTQQWLSFVANSGSGVTNWIRSGTTLNNPASQSASTKAQAYAFDDNWYYTGNTPPPSYPTTNVSNFLFDDSNSVFSNILSGTWAPYCLTPNYSNKAATSPTPPYVYGPGFKWRNYNGATYQSPPPQNTLDQVASVDIVITPDTKLWSQCVVFETGEDEATNEGDSLYHRTSLTQLAGNGAFKGQIRMAYSKNWHDPVNRDYLETVTNDKGRSWFPGYAIDVETGARLNIAFGESSDMGEQNGRDMLWNPTSTLYNPISFPGSLITQLPYFGGKHFIYVMNTRYDEGAAAQKLLLRNYDSLTTGQYQISPSLYPVYRSLMWTCIPYLTPSYSFVGDGTPNPAYIPPSTVTIKLRVQKPYARMLAASPSPGKDSLPVYTFSTIGLGATQNNLPLAKTALDQIKVVPNPYLAYSAYESTANAATVYVTNLPNTCTISIYALDGTLIRVLQRAIGPNNSNNQSVETSKGEPITQVNVSTSVSWDLTNTAGIPIASGIYLFHIDAPGIGQTTLKWFGAVRPDNITNY